MARFVKRLIKRLLLLSLCFCGVIILLTREFSQGALSPRSFGFTILMVAIGTGAWAVLIFKFSAQECSAALGPTNVPLDVDARKSLRRGIWGAKFLLVLLVLGLVVGLTSADDAPWWVTLIGVTVNLGLTTVTMMRLRQMRERLGESQTS